MNIEELEVFIEVAKRKNVSQAASRLFLTQPTVSKKIKRLEKEIGFPLFNRQHQGVTLTKAGERFYQSVSEIPQQLAASIELARTVSKEKTIKIAAPSSYSHLFFSQLIPYLEKQHIVYEFYHFHSNEILSLLQDSVIDLALLEADGLVSDSIDIHSILKDPIVPCCAPSHRFNTNKERTLSTLSKEKLALYKWGKEFQTLVEILEKENFCSSASRRITPLSTVKELLFNQDYIAFLPYHTVKKEIEDKRLITLDVRDSPSLFYHLSLAYKKETKESRTEHLEEIIEFLT